MIVEIAPEKRTSVEKDTFSYLVPEELIDKIKVGSICTISFGRKTVRGVVFVIDNQTKPEKLEYEIKPIKSIQDNFVIPGRYLHIAKWIAEYYLCSLGEAVSLFLPPDIKRPRVQKVESRKSKVENSEQAQLTQEQGKVFLELKKLLSIGHKSSTINQIALLHGVTGSGKTEIYLKLVEELILRPADSKQAIVLVPEIMLTPQTIERFEKAFPGNTCLVHSGLSKSEKFNAYNDFYHGRNQILIGPRSALLVPSKNLGLIIIDEEQEDAYKQEKTPRYHAVDLAKKIGKEHSALLVLGTATPRIETYWEAMEKKIGYFELKSRFGKDSLPSSKIVDLKDEIKNDNYSPISLELQSKIKETLNNKKQTLLFLNRRGMSTFVSCRECGEIINCPRCEIPLVYHINQGVEVLNCHHCDFNRRPPSTCPNCGGSKIKFFGAGVDKIEKEIERLFPDTNIVKIDSKSLQNKGEYASLYKSLKDHKIDILIGTQILAKGLDIPNVDLVGVVSADTGLHMPHFRASENTFQILTQVSGRSGRKKSLGHTVIQTYWPESFAIKSAAGHDYNTFYKSEIIEREGLTYPPFCHLVRVVVQDRNKTKAKNQIDAIALELTAEKLTIIGPAPCFLSRVNNFYRYHLLIKTTELPNSSIKKIFTKFPYATWDIDPTELL